jgi:V8-like Glu-specific endopeptidase
MMKRLSTTILFCCWACIFAAAQTPSRLLLNAGGQNQRYNGIGQLRGGTTCTAVFIKVSDAANAPAYALTNGHCINLLSANEVLLDQPPGARRVVFNYFQDTPDKQHTINLRRIVWAAMKGTDLAVLELDATFQQLVEMGLQPWELATSDPLPDEAIHIVGVPVTGIPSAQAFLRVAECTSGARVNLVEFSWHFFDMWRNQCADIKGGSSGSPVLSVARNQIIALINTTTADSPPYGDCYLGRPCELTPEGPRVIEGTNYAITLTGVRECFDEAGKFALTRAGCALDDGKQLRVAGYPLTSTQPWVRDTTGALRRVTWNITISGTDFTHYRYKLGREEDTDCRNPAGYGAAIKLADNHRVNDEIPEREGRYNFCLLGGNAETIDDQWQSPRFATQVHVAVDVTPPVIPLSYQVRALTNDRWSVQPIFVVPELSSYLYKFGKFGETDCSDGAGYRDYLRVPVNVDGSASPQTFCLIGRDNALNQTPVRELLFEGQRWYEIYRHRPPRVLRNAHGQLPTRH